jgi:BlaI family penicillinase repressor
MKEIPRITEAEWQVMQVLWAESPRTANEVVEALTPTTTWHPKTIKTLINRLLNKNAIGFDKKGKAYHYYPLVDEAECMTAESRTFLKRMYGGALKPMLVHFLKSQQLSPEEVAELKRILEEEGG